MALAALLAATWAHREGFSNPYVLNPDARQHTYWMESFRDPELFENDPIAEYSRAYQPRGVVALYRVLAPIVAPLTLGRILPLLLLAAAAWFAFRLAEHLGGIFAGVLAGLWLTLAPVFLHKMAGGHARAFAVPLLLAFLDALLRAKPFRVGLSLLLLALTYPMIFLVAAATGGLDILRPSAERAGRAMALAVVAGAIVGSLCLLYEKQHIDRALWGPLPTYDELVDRPELTAAGRVQVLPTPPFPQIMGEELLAVARPFSPLPSGHPRSLRTLWLLAALALATVGAVALRGPRLPAAIGALTASAFLLYSIADLVLLRLFLPQRYLEAPFRVLYVLAGSLLIAGCVERFVPERGRGLTRAAILLFMAFHLGALDGAGLEDRSAARPLATYLATTPKGDLIAAHPVTADDIPLFARRRVLVDHEHAHPFYPEHWKRVRATTEAFFEAYYAAGRAAVCSFLAERRVDHLVIDERHFSREAITDGVYFEPFGSQIRERIGERRRFALLELEEEEVDFEDGSLRVTSAASLGCAREGGSPAAAQSM